MPRLARLDAPGVLHRVIIRGIERKKIFRSNKDRDDLLEHLGELIAPPRLPVTPGHCCPTMPIFYSGPGKCPFRISCGDC
jgi:hypothetical protein